MIQVHRDSPATGVLNIELHKHQTRTDWSQGPLDDQQQYYPLADFAYLEEQRLEVEQGNLRSLFRNPLRAFLIKPHGA